ncbi:MAG TPA: hypothetical protein VI078_00250, partial [bacterium]
MVPARSLLKIARAVAPALAAVALALWAASLLPRPWSLAAAGAVVALALAAALLALDIVAPGVNLFSRA